MMDAVTLWAKVLPEIKDGVTGVGVWSALNQAKPVIFEDGTFVIGIPHEVGELAGHLRLQQTKVLMEQKLTAAVGDKVQLRVIDGIAIEDWEMLKRRDIESQRLQEQALNRQRAEMASRTNWDAIYDQISRKFASIPNKSLAQNRAKFYTESVAIIVEALKTIPISDELSERNFARCIERVATYAEVPSTLVALRIQESAGK